MNQDGVNPREYGRGAGDAESQREDGEGGKPDIAG
jgi:hypothetical protein